MNTDKIQGFYVKRWKCESPIPNALPPPLCINNRLSLPSLCKDLHNDGAGESFEQHPVHTRDGDLYVSLWQSGGDYFMKPEQEFKQMFPEQEQGMQFNM